MKKMLIASTALLTLASGAAMAADLSRPPPAPAPVYTKAPPMMTLFTWTGCYIGGNGGGVWATKDLSDYITGTSIGSIDASGGVAGGQVGCNYQFGSWVVGVQGDYDWADASGNINDLFNGTSDSVKVKSVASVTGRVGYAWDRFLAYVKGGGAWETDDYGATAPNVSLALTGDSRTGWTIGGGGEYAFTDWLTGFVEYDYYDFGTKDENLSGTINNVAATVGVNVKETKSVAKAGLNFKFGGWH